MSYPAPSRSMWKIRLFSFKPFMRYSPRSLRYNDKQQRRTRNIYVIGECPWQMSSVLIVQVIMVRPCQPHDTLPKIILQGTAEGNRHRGKPRKSWKDEIEEWTTDQSLSLLLATEVNEQPSQQRASVGVKVHKHPKLRVTRIWVDEIVPKR